MFILVSCYAHEKACYTIIDTWWTFRGLRRSKNKRSHYPRMKRYVIWKGRTCYELQKSIVDNWCLAKSLIETLLEPTEYMGNWRWETDQESVGNRRGWQKEKGKGKVGIRDSVAPSGGEHNRAVSSSQFIKIFYEQSMSSILSTWTRRTHFTDNANIYVHELLLQVCSKHSFIYFWYITLIDLKYSSASQKLGLWEKLPSYISSLDSQRLHNDDLCCFYMKLGVVGFTGL